MNDPPAKVITPLSLRAPELVLNGNINRTVDIWSFDCLVFELMTGTPLFCVPGNGTEEDENDEHLSPASFSSSGKNPHCTSRQSEICITANWEKSLMGRSP